MLDLHVYRIQTIYDKNSTLFFLPGISDIDGDTLTINPDREYLQIVRLDLILDLRNPRRVSQHRRW